MARKIHEILARRTDLGAFLVHLTRGESDASAKENLKSIIRGDVIEARTPFGPAASKVADVERASQRCVCFTETPLEHVALLIGDIQGRAVQMRGYGIAIPKKLARKSGVNPVWYTDISPGHEWLMNSVNALIDRAIEENNFLGSPISKVAPFIEQMGPTAQTVKEFWWEREWRHVGNFHLPRRIVVLCPEREFAEFREFGDPVVCIDPAWSLEQLIARLVGYNSDDSDVFAA